MALWSEITGPMLAADVWLQARRAAGDPAECRRRLAAAEVAVPAWRRAVRRQLSLSCAGAPGPLQLGIVWYQYRAAQQHARIWRTLLKKLEQTG